MRVNNLKKNKSKEFLCCFYIVKLFLYFSFFIFYPFQCLACISCYVKNFKFYSRIFLVILFHFQGEHFMTLKRATIRNNLKFLTSPAERTHHEIFSVLYQEMLLMNVTKTVFRIVLPWFQITSKIIKDFIFIVIQIFLINQVSMCHPEAYSEPCQISKTKRFAKIVKNF